MTTPDSAECFSCRSLAGEARISPGPFIYEGQYWMVDHAYPVALAGWLVIVLKRHAAALHELSADEFQELGALQYRAVQALRRYTGCAKEYLMAFAEAPGFQHLHVHVVPRAADLPPEQQGPRIMQFLQPDAAAVVPPDTIRAVSEDLRRLFAEA
jgi:diadenosine tetraphosphate (Ap4A) HIT family hydrolase